MWNIDWTDLIVRHSYIVRTIFDLLLVYAGFTIGRDFPRKSNAFKRGKGKMPQATIINAVSDKIPLKSLPDGYVVVRRMTYGERLSRQAMATKFVLGGNAKDNSGSFQGEIDIQTKELALWDFANLVVEHNLTDHTDRPLNFKNPVDVNNLNGAVGDEIGTIIDNFNDAVNSDEVKNS